MSITGTAKGGDLEFKVCPEGTHVAICNMIVEIGLQIVSYQGKESTKPQVYFRWEIPSERIEWIKDGVEHEGPLCVGNIYNCYMGEKANLGIAIEAWRGIAFRDESERESFDIGSMIGKACLVTVKHSKDGKYANVKGVTALPKGMFVPQAENKPVLFELGQNSENLPKWLQTKIMERVVDDYEPPLTENPAPVDQHWQDQIDHAANPQSERGDEKDQDIPF